ncbi:MAG: phosphoglycerate kinase [bacterium]
MDKMTIRDVDVSGKRVLVRVDFNVPLKEGKIRDDTRIKAALPTIEYLISHGARLILMSHLGRPDGEVDDAFRMDPVAARLADLLARPVKKLNDCIGPEVEAAVNSLKPGELILLENVRFHKGETKNNPEFAEALSRLGDIYVNDAFGTAHRAHASTEGVTKYLPAVGGFLMEKELEFLGKVTANPAHPFVAILGGAKVSDKIGVLKNLVGKVDTMLIGGGMAFTFLYAQGKKIGKSLLDEKIELAREILDEARVKGVKFLLPTDVVVAEKLEEGVPFRVVSNDEIPDEMMGVDIGPRTVEAFSEALRGAKTVLWNGPMGVFEIPAFAKGTEAVARAVADSGAISIIGGGDSVAAVAKLGLNDRMTHISTGGGASLEFLEGKVLPGVAALRDKE